MISGVVITLNEERNIERCIQSMQGVCDEIIVLDSYSTDNTKAICEGLNVRFIEKEWLGYSASKNYANSLAKHDYILSIDADECLSEELKESIKHQKNNGLSGAYSLNRLTNYMGTWVKHCGWYPDKKVRLFPKDVLWEGAYVHEELNLKDYSVQELNGKLHHYSYYDTKDHRARADKYSLLTAQKMNAKGKKAGPLKPYISAIAKFNSVYFIKLGFLDGKAGWNIARISALSNIVKYKELRRLNVETSK